MKVAFITSRYPTFDAPYNHMFVHIRCLELNKLGVNVTVLVPSYVKKEYIYEGIEVVMDYSVKLIDRLSGFDVSYIHLLNIYLFNKTNGWPIYKHIRVNKLPFAMFIHGNDVQKYSSRMYEFQYRLSDILRWIKKDIVVIPMIKSFVKKTYKRDNVHFIFPSLWMKQEAERNLDIQFNSNFSIIPTGIETDFFKQVKTVTNKYKIITIRSLSKNVYNIEKTIRVMALLPKKYTLSIYGEGIFLKKYNNLISKLDLDDRVKITPQFFNKQEMKDIFKEYGIYISTTRMDSQGVNMMEAMAAGLLVVTTNNSSKEEYIENLVNGILAKTDQSIADAIVDVVEDNNTFNQVVSNGRKSIEKINIKTTIIKELSVLKNTLAK